MICFQSGLDFLGKEGGMKGCVGVHTQMNMEARGQCPIASSFALDLIV